MRNEVTIVLGQRKLLQRFGPGLMHAFIFWGFLVLLPTIVIAMIAIVDKHATFPWLGHQGWYAFLVDLFAVLVLVGVAAALWIRKVQRPRRFEGSHLGEADLILALIATIATTLLLWHATRIALGLNEWPASSAPVSNVLSHLFADNEVTRVLERVFVWAHVLTILAFLAYLPRSKHLHIATAAFNVWFGRTGAGGRLEPLRFDDPDVPEEEIRFGAGTAADLTWKQVLDTFSCTECGRCQDACPAFATGKVLSPKLLIMGLRDQVFAQGDAPLVPDAVPEESVWDCVTCGACVQACPVSIEHVDHIVDLRRHLVMVESSFPSEAEPMLRDVERASNPWGRAQSERADWAAELGVRVLEPGDPAPEYLYWVGCASSFDERARTSARVDGEAAAGGRRRLRDPRPAGGCTGDPARRIGNEYVFQAFAEQNVETLERGRRHEDRRQLPALLQHARQRVPRLRRPLRGDPPLRAALARSCATAGCARALRTPVDHLPRLLLPRAPQRRARRAARARRRGRRAGRDGALGQADVLLRRRRRPHVDGGARQADQRRARARGGRDRRRHARGRVPVLHGDARRRRPERGGRAARRRRRDAAGRGDRRPIGVKQPLELALEPGVADVPDLERQADDAAAALGGGAGRGRRALRQPHHPRVVAEVVVAQLGVAVEAELAHDRVLERAREEVGEEVRARLLGERRAAPPRARARRSSARPGAAATPAPASTSSSAP